MGPFIKKTIAYSVLLFFLFFQMAGFVFSQPRTTGGDPEIRLGEITLNVREFESTPSRSQILEIHITVLNKSHTSTAPPHSIKVVVVPKEMTFPEGAARSAFDPGSGEITLDSPLPPNTGRVVILGFLLPEAKPESITFEIQMDPPDGEKKIVKWEGN